MFARLSVPQRQQPRVRDLEAKRALRPRRVERAFRSALKLLELPASAEVNLMSVPHRGVTTESTYFVTANVCEKRSLFQVEKIARVS